MLKRILKQAAEVSLVGVESPDYNLEKWDKIIGVLTDELKQLFAVMINAHKKYETNIRQVHEWTNANKGKEVPKNEDDAMREKYFLCQNEYEMAKNCFWGCVRDKFPQIAGRKVYIGSNWQVVLSGEDAQIKEFLQNLFSGLLNAIH